MRTVLVVVALGLAALATVAPAEADLDRLVGEFRLSPGGGQTPPPLALAGLDGARVSLADLSGRPVFVYFWASW